MSEKHRPRRILDLRMPMDHSALTSVLEQFISRYSCLSVTAIGQSILGRTLPMIRLGGCKEGEERRRVLYIGSHHGMEWITSAVLLRFVNEYCELLSSDGMAEGVRVRNVFESCGIYVLPMLNPDGVDYALHGVSADNILRERLRGMNGESEDFSHWQANARGVDLNHNYNAGFAEYKKLESENGIYGGGPTRFAGECPESEPETAYLCNYLRFNRPFDAVLTLHSQGEEIYYTSGDAVAPDSERVGRYLSRVSGYRLSKPEGLAAYGGFTDWFIREFGKPSFTVECGKGENPLPISAMPMIYLKLRRAFFELPLLL